MPMNSAQLAELVIRARHKAPPVASTTIGATASRAGPSGSACTASTVNRTAAHQAGDAAGSVGWGSFKIRAKTGHKAWRGRLGQCPGRFTFMDYLLDPLSY